MTPQEIAEVRPRLAVFAGKMLGGLTRSDQRAAGELYVRGMLTDGRRKSMQPMAESRSYLGWHQHVTLAALVQAFITMLRTDPKAPAPG